ncbi:cation transporter [Azospirillum oryzae]|uniref:Cation transporter n=1 Tax=Azospirillum oryzae TaxID=286727 RepID=A0A6N1AKZ5_9PROT|nr:cation diffusion facilitator family transporter [Azospirillum oryzae]KAA0590174.1 cation transporter [Azospirillum oryzae]QKS52009.1 cation transporter [Azospirillum oryzae]GLR77956.1 cobalt transporter [Azospirillum oryzae]
MPHGHSHGGSSEAGHDHGDHHHHGPARYDRSFALGALLNIGFVVVEAVYGLLANSTALLADAGHNLSDVMGLLLAWGAVWLGRRIPQGRYTYGFGNASILASLLNAMILLIAVGAILLEAAYRLADPQPVAETTVMVVAVIGIVINAWTAWLFMGGQKQDINLRGAYLHMAADAAVSVGVVIAALAIRFTGWLWLDPVTSIVIALVIIAGTWGLLRDSVRLAMDAVPDGIDRAEVERYLAGLPGVEEVHDLHIWPISTTETALTAHLVRPGTDQGDGLLLELSSVLKDRFGIGHATIQVEQDGSCCRLAPPEVV